MAGWWRPLLLLLLLLILAVLRKLMIVVLLLRWRRLRLRLPGLWLPLRLPLRLQLRLRLRARVGHRTDKAEVYADEAAIHQQQTVLVIAGTLAVQ